jgi:hypothetical protein
MKARKNFSVAVVRGGNSLEASKRKKQRRSDFSKGKKEIGINLAWGGMAKP